MTDSLPLYVVTITGRDAPGITQKVMAALSEGRAEVLDIEQVVLHDLLTLTLLVEIGDISFGDRIASIIHAKLHQPELTVVVRKFKDREYIRRSRVQTYAVTCLGASMPAQFLEALAARLASDGYNIEKITTLSEKHFRCVELILYGGKAIDHGTLKRSLLPLANRFAIDLAVQRETLHRRNKRLLVMDVDSTLLQGEIIDEIAAEAGVAEQVSSITRRTMAGELDFQSALRARVKLLQGVTTAQLDQVAGRMHLNPGADSLIRTLRRLGYKIAIISGGFTYFTDRLRAELGLDHAYANALEIRDGILTGETTGPIIDGAEKARLLRQIAQTEGIPLDQVVAVGDGANDVQMLAAAGLGIAYNAKAVLRESADVSLNNANLEVILYLLGIGEADRKAMEDSAASNKSP